MDKAKQTGDLGEKAVAEFILSKGYIISAMNYRTRFGEIDIIAENNERILFVEVKTRSENRIIEPYEFVDPIKQNKIFVTANIYLQNNGIDLQPRFDVASVIKDKDGKMHIKYFKNAFGADSFANFRSSL